MSVLRFLFLSIFIFSMSSFAKSSNDAIVATSQIELIAGLAKPPFIIEENGKGMQLDIIREALSTESYSVNFLHIPLGRNITSYQRLNLDGLITLPNNYEHPAMYLSSPYITYQNVAISLTENKFIINKISALANKSVVAFQHAKKFLGDDYSNAISFAIDYQEQANQIKQIEKLFLRNTEVIILDINIFKHFIKTTNDKRFQKPFRVHYIFKPRHYSAGFRDEALRDKFDHGIKRMKDDGSYQKIIDNYLN